MGMFSTAEERRIKRERKLTLKLSYEIQRGHKVKAASIVDKFEKPMRLLKDDPSARRVINLLFGGEHCWNGYASDRMDIFYKMLNAGLDVNTTLEGDRTLLGIASWCGTIDIVETLLEEGADKHIADEWNKTPVLRAIDRQHWDVVASLGREENIAIHENIPQIVGQLIEQAAPGYVLKLFDEYIKQKPEDYLIKAIISSNEGFVDHFFSIYPQNTADVFENKGLTALLSAIGYNRLNIFKKLIQAGFDYQVQREDGYDCFKHIAYTGDELFLDWMLAKCQDDGVKLPTEGVLEQAVKGASISIMKRLVEYGCNLNETVGDDNKPLLLYALEENKKEVAAKLISLGANVHLADANGMTPAKFIIDHTDGALLSAIKSAPSYAEAVTAAPAKSAQAGNYALLDKHAIELRQGALSTVFNFHTGQVITRDKESSGLHIQSFADVPRTQALLDAEKMLLQLGGELPEGYTTSSSSKKTPTIPSKTR